MSHLLNCSAHLKSTADLKPDAWELMRLKGRLTLISNTCKNWGLQLRLASFIPAELIAMARLCLCQRHISWDRRLRGSVSRDSLLAVSSEGFSHWTPLPEAASPLLFLPFSDQLSQSYKSSSFLFEIKCSRSAQIWRLAATAGLLRSVTDDL